MGNLTSF